MSRKDWIIKSVSIEASDAKIIRAQGEGFNLSRFVRECLRRHSLHQDQKSMLHRQPAIQERTGVCLPRSMCPVCWPEGAPTEYNFDLFRGKDPRERNESSKAIDAPPSMPYEGPEVANLEWLRSTIDEAFPIDGIDARGNAKPSFVEKPDSLISKLRKKWQKRP